MFDPLDYNYDPEVMATQKQLDRANRDKSLDFNEGFTGGQDLSTDEGRQAWATAGLPGLLLSKLYDEDSQKEWFIQRNAVDLAFNQLKEIISAYENISKTRRLTKQEQGKYSEAVGRRDLLSEDLAFVYENFDGDLDATLDVEGNSFNDRWGIDVDEEGNLSDLLGLFIENPSYAGGAITADVIKELPLLGVAKLLGIAHKGLDMATLVSKVNARLNKIEPKLLRGLSKVGTGSAAGAGIGAAYEGTYSGLEQGEVKGADVSLGAKFGGTFGLLGGAALMLKGPKSKAVASEVETVAPAVQPKTPREVSAIKQVEKVLENIDKERVSEISKETSIFPDIEHDVKSIKGHSSEEGTPFTTVETLDGKIKTIVNETLLTKAHSTTLEELRKALKEDGEFRGVPASRIRGRDIENLSNPDVFRMFGLAHEKAKALIIRDTHSKGQPVPKDIERQAWTMALNELNMIDAKRAGPNSMKQIDEATQLTPEELEAERIRKARQSTEEPTEETLPEPATTPVADFIKKNPKTSLGLGAAAGYGLASENEKFSGVALGVGAVLGGPAAYKAITSTALKASAMKAKVAMSKDIERFSAESKALEVKMQWLLEDVKETFNTPSLGLALIKSLEEGTTKGLTKKQIEVRNSVRTLLDEIGTEAVKSGVLKDKGDVTQIRFGEIINKDKQGHFLNNYFPHLFDVDISEEKLQSLINVYLKESKSGTQRTMMGTIEELQAKHPELIADPVRALDTYTRAMTRTIYGKNLINSMQQFDLSSTGDRLLPALMSKDAYKSLITTEAKHGGLSSQEELHYTEFEHPTLKGFVAHSDIKPMMNEHFVLIRRGGLSDVKEGILKLNNGLKRIFVFGSLFHAQALVLSSMYSLGVTGAIKGLGKKIEVKDPKTGKVIGHKEVTLADLKLGTGQFKESALEAIKDGLGIINVKSSDLVNPGFDDVSKLLEKGGLLGQKLGKGFDKIDHITWEQLHDRFKLATYIQKKHKLLEDNLKLPESQRLSEEAIGKLAARYANDAYGGLDWNDFGTSLYTYAQNNPTKIRGILADKLAGLVPANKRRWLNLGLFAPDWTISNLRIVGNMFFHGKKYSEGFLKSLHKGDTAAWKSKEGRELSMAFKMYAAYTAKAGAITSGMWWGMMQVNNALWDNNPEPTADGLFEFWFGEDSGKMELGGGESMVISKQISEPYHWLQHPRHTLLNKMSIVPKTVMEGLYNKQWFSLKKGFPMGPAITDPDGTTHYTKWILGKTIPISMKPLVDDQLSASERFERTVTGFFGFPQYGTYYDDNIDYSKHIKRDFSL
jgi:hypothetical protein